MQVSVVIYRGEDYSNYHDALKDGAVYDYILPKSFSDLSVSDFQVDKAMSVADMLGQPSIVAVIIGNGHVYGEIEFGNINFDSLEALKPDAFKSMTKYSFSISTNTIWFDGDNGELMAYNYNDAREKAQNVIRKRIEQINRKLDGLDIFNIDLEEIQIKEIE